MSGLHSRNREENRFGGGQQVCPPPDEIRNVSWRKFMGKKKKKRITWVELKQYIPLYVMLLPACIYFFINNYIPMPGIIVAFKKYSKRKTA